MKNVVKGLLLITGLLAVNVTNTSAQVKWDSPMGAPPRPTPGLGLFLVDVDGGGAGALLTWQPTARSWGFRIGIAESREDIAVYGGGDVSGAITRSRADFPLDMDWVFGVGASIGDVFVVSVPAGITVGHTFNAESAQITPYLTPRVILDGWFGDDGPGDGNDLELGVAVDIGVDLRFSQDWKIRFGGSLGDRDGIMIGVVF